MVCCCGTHATPRVVLNELYNVTSDTKQRDSYISSLLLCNVPVSAQRYMEKNGVLVEVKSVYEAQRF